MEVLPGRWFLASARWCSHLPWRVHTLLLQCRSPSQRQSERVKKQNKFNINNEHQNALISVILSQEKLWNPFTLNLASRKVVASHPGGTQIQHWLYAISWPCPKGPFSMKIWSVNAMGTGTLDSKFVIQRSGGKTVGNTKWLEGKNLRKKTTEGKSHE